MVSILTEVKGKHAVAAVIYHALYAYFFCQLSIAKLATVFGKAENTIRSWIDRYEREGLVGRQQLAAVPSKFSLEERVWVYEFYKRNPTKYLKEAVAAFRKNFKKYISKTTIWSILHRDWNMTWKALERRAIQIKEFDIIRFANELNSINWCKYNILFLDEVSFDNRGIVRSRGYGHLGQRLPIKGEFKRISRVSLLVMVNVFGVAEVFMTEGTFTRHKFFDACIDLAESGKCGMYPGKNSIWIMDGARIHTHPKISLELRRRGIIPIFLPAYCPFYNPIEILFGWVKRRMREEYPENKFNNTKDLAGFVMGIMRSFRFTDLEPIFDSCGYSEARAFNPTHRYTFDSNSAFVTQA